MGLGQDKQPRGGQEDRREPTQAWGMHLCPQKHPTLQQEREQGQDGGGQKEVSGTLLSI